MIKKVIRKINSKQILNYINKKSNCKIPYCVRLYSGKKGPTVLIAGSMHGNEHVGAKFIKYFLKNIDSGKIKLKKGNLFLLLANPQAFEKDVRFIDVNLNRVFTKEKDLSFLEYRRALEIENFFKKKHIDYVLDLHSVSADDSKMLVVKEDELEKMNFILKNTSLDTVFAFKGGILPGTMIEHFIDKKGAVAYSIECGNHFKRKAIEIAKHEVFALLNHLGMVDKRVQKQKKKPVIYRTINYIKTGPNFKWLLKPQTGTKVIAGGAFAKDDRNGEQKAEKDSYLFMPSKHVDEKDHDAGFLVEKVNIEY